MTLEEIAELAAVSRSTVSRVINNHPNVRPDVRARVWEVVERQGYAPNAAARSLATKRTNILGLLLPQSARDTFTDPFFSLLIPSITETCSQHRRYLMLSMVTADQELEFYRHVLRAGHLDGLIVGVSLMDDPILPLLINDPLPLVLLGHHPYYPQANWVDVDSLQCAAEAVSFLIQNGRRRIATITLPLTLIAGLDRRDGYKRALLQHRMPIDPDLIVETESFTNGGYLAMQRLLALPEPPDAVFTASDSLAIGAMAAIRAAGLRVPEDIAVVGFDDQPSAMLADPPLTTVRQPIAELGRRAVELLMALIEGETNRPQHVMLPTSLVMRASA